MRLPTPDPTRGGTTKLVSIEAMKRLGPLLVRRDTAAVRALMANTMRSVFVTGDEDLDHESNVTYAAVIVTERICRLLDKHAGELGDEQYAELRRLHSAADWASAKVVSFEGLDQPGVESPRTHEPAAAPMGDAEIAAFVQSALFPTSEGR